MSTLSRSPVRRLAVARLISLTGSAAAYLALNYAIYQRTHSAVWVAAALLLTFGTLGAAGPFAGALGDRFDRRKVMIVSDLTGAVCFGAMAVAHAPWLLLASIALSGGPRWSRRMDIASPQGNSHTRKLQALWQFRSLLAPRSEGFTNASARLT